MPTSGHHHGHDLPQSGVRIDELLHRPTRSPDYEGESRALASLNDAIANAPESLLQRLVDTALELCRADSAGISVVDANSHPELFRWKAVAGQLAKHNGFGIPREGSICDLVVQQDTPLLFAYPERHFGFAPNSELAIAEVLLVPIHVNRKPTGTLWVVSHDPIKRFDLEDQRLLTSLARVASAAHQITFALIQLGMEVDAITRLHDLSALLVRERQVDRLLSEILDTAIAVGSADFGTIQLLDSTTGRLKIVAHRGFPQWWLDFWESVTEGHGSCGTALLLGKRIIIDDVEDSEVYAEEATREAQRRAGVRAVQSTPLIGRSGKLLGMFSTHYKTTKRFDERALRLLDLLAWQAAELIDRTQTEIAMQRIEDRFRLLVETSSAVTWTSPASVLHTEPQPSWTANNEQSKEEMLDDGWTKTVHPDDLPEAIRKWNESIRRGIPYLNEHRICRADGDWCWMSVHAVPVRDSTGNITEWIGMNFDISERKRAEAELYDREARLQAILKTATDAIISIDEKGTITNVNPATERMFGYSRAEMIGNNIKMLMPTPFRNEHDGYLRRYINTGERRIIGRSREATARRKDGTVFPVELSVAEIHQERKFTGFIRDVSERKKLQRHLLDIVAEEQQRISCELHDGIQQELTGLSLFAGVLRQTVLDLAEAGNDQDIERGELNSRKFADALRLLQDASGKLTQGLADTHRHVQELAHGIMPVAIDADGLRNALDSLAKGVGPHVKCLFTYSGNVSIEDNNTASHVFRIAQESLTNAIRHGNATSVRIELKDTDGRFILQIEDNGSGFDPFTITQGMGLRTMEYRASLIGGILQLERARERGMIVRCVFPRHLGPTNHEPLPVPLASAVGKGGSKST